MHLEVFGGKGQSWENLKQPPNTRVCRVMREELLPYYYKTKTSISWQAQYQAGGETTELCAWLKAIGETNRQNVGEFEFSFLAAPFTSHNWPIRRFRQALRTKCGMKVALHEIECADGRRIFRVEMLS